MYSVYRDRDKLRKLDSAVVLEDVDSTTSSTFHLHQDKPRGYADSVEQASVKPVGLDVSIRYGRLGVVVVLAVSVLVGLTITFNRGVVIGHFDPTPTDTTAQKKLLDDYNSYTGNVASAFAGPIGIVVVQLLMLRVLATPVLRPEVGWKLRALTFVLSTGIGYLVGNGMNALNVQPQQPTIESIISAVDLSYASSLTVSQSTNITQTFSERTARNPLTNTALRNLVLPRAPIAKPFSDFLTRPKHLGLEHPPGSIIGRDWQRRLLQEALEPKQFLVVVNETNKDVNKYLDVDDLPMNASLAAELFLYSMFIAPHRFRFDYFRERTDIQARFPNTPVADTVANITQLLPPPTPVRHEKTQREWFLRESVAGLALALNTSTNFSRSDVVMEFSHVDISPTMSFDAITIELEVDLMLVGNTSSNDNSTRYNNVDPRYQLQAFGTCLNDQGEEQLTVNKSGVIAYNLRFDVKCERVSNSSLMVMSIGKRFVADSITQNKTMNASGYIDSDQAVVKNMRRIYTFTIAKLSWKLSNLSVEFNAECAKDAGACQGLRFPLTPTTKDQSPQQELIVGADALPMDMINPLELGIVPRYRPLVLLHEPSANAIYLEEYSLVGLTFVSYLIYDTVAGDPLLPHNIGDITWDLKQPPPANRRDRNLFIEERLQLILNNHMYIEHGLQTAYTAATFFLLENGVVKDVVKRNDKQNSLNFQRNKQLVALLASIPDQNAWLTLGGCAVLVISLCSVIVWAWSTSHSSAGGHGSGLGYVTEPQVVARVMLDAAQFPPMFLHRRVLGDDNKAAAPMVEDFVIDGLTLQPATEAKESS